MLKRYSSSGNGKRKVVAKVYLSNEHKINPLFIDKDAFFIISRLQKTGYAAYIVGGAVRDLLLGKEPKDFDIATDAKPADVKRLFRNSRIIGRRFRLVHVYYGDKMLEVSTFRSLDKGKTGKNHNLYGSIEDDVKRRDFSINALYWDPVKNQVIDYVDAMLDIRSKVLRSLIPLNITFSEDPVRIIRAIKYAETTSCKIARDLKNKIASSAKLLEKVPSSRMTEELFKILGSSASCEIFQSMLKAGLLKYFLPSFYGRLSKEKKTTQFFVSLQKLDQKVQNGKKQREYMLFHFCIVFFCSDEFKTLDEELPLPYTYKKIKQLIAPLTPPNVEVEKCGRLILRELGVKARRRTNGKKPPYKNKDNKSFILPK